MLILCSPRIIFFGLVTSLVLGTTNARASLIGDFISEGCLSGDNAFYSCTLNNTNYFTFPSGSGTTATVVDPGVEFTRVIDPGGSSERTLTADFTADILTLTVDGSNSNWTSGGSHSSNQWEFNGLDVSGGPGGILSLTPLGGSLIVNSSSFTTDSIFIITSDIPFTTLNGNVFSSSFQINDQDSDGIVDNVDNCTNAANADQIDTDSDGHGNACDADFDNTCETNIFDLFSFKGAFGSSDPADAQFDLDNSGQVNIFDLFIFKNLFGSAPGPSPVGSLCNP